MHREVDRCDWYCGHKCKFPFLLPRNQVSSRLQDRYKSFLRTLRMWRHLRMLKRGARTYDKTGVKGTSPGELTVVCPACPIPSINLPPKWRSVDSASECVAVSYERPSCFTHAFVTGICTIKLLASMHVSGSRDGKFRIMRKTQSLGLGMHILLPGDRIASTSGGFPTRMRFVFLVIC